ncbi:DUF3429 domain-containing protein [uncultured Caulobacter sp.]|uniref:DUF3429 domain-containing protein n=1 Tax=uncultured Caulobacter sp. TaxID=158749 RepID=UPI00263086B1|nr:DUF3429 domain-containing protein [uncultured Caulobacter sp.]
MAVVEGENQGAALASTMSVLGALGLAPFVAPPLAVFAGLIAPPVAWVAQAAYASAILAFLAGTRAAHAALGPHADRTSLLISMLPPLVGFAAAAVVARDSAGLGAVLGLLALALALALHGVWDVTAAALPDWYRRLRAPLTVVACGALLLGAWGAGLVA